MRREQINRLLASFKQMLKSQSSMDDKGEETMGSFDLAYF
jgi:hypothetical protein